MVGRDNLSLGENFSLALSSCLTRGGPLIEREVFGLKRVKQEMVVVQLVPRWARAAIAGLSVVIRQLYRFSRREPFVWVSRPNRQTMSSTRDVHDHPMVETTRLWCVRIPDRQGKAFGLRRSAAPGDFGR
jgi:hypothetical protein